MGLEPTTFCMASLGEACPTAVRRASLSRFSYPPVKADSLDDW